MNQDIAEKIADLERKISECWQERVSHTAFLRKFGYSLSIPKICSATNKAIALSNRYRTLVERLNRYKERKEREACLCRETPKTRT